MDTCCLCGKELAGEIDDDHVPPKQFFPKELRKLHSPNLQTVRGHRRCNASFQKDEDYFVHALGPLAMRTPAGGHLLRDIFTQTKRLSGVRLVKQTLAEFTPQVAGLWLPDGRMAKQFDGDRARNVVWKITPTILTQKMVQLPGY